MKKEFKGFHSEWNLGSPGGWEYQRMLQEIYAPIWDKIKKISGIELELDFNYAYFKPSLGFAKIMLEKSKQTNPQKDPFIILMAEEETLDDVIENKSFVEYLNSLPNVKAALIGPQELKLKDGRVFANNEEPTAIFIDFNVSVLVELEKKHSIDPIVEAIKRDLVVNPKGMEAINSKSLFELIEKFSDKLSKETVERTPWTRVFRECNTTGPNGEKIENLVQWAKDNWDKIILKPESGWSGKGVIMCATDEMFEDGKIKPLPSREYAIEKALSNTDHGRYIIQELVSTDIWSEMMPEIVDGGQKVELKRRQTDFRCLISHKGLLGFVSRYGRIPTNVGAGGGVQPLALILSDHSNKEATEIINRAFLEMDIKEVKKIRQEIDKVAIKAKFTYLNGAIPTSLRPRFLQKEDLENLRSYGENLYRDTLFLEEKWKNGELNDVSIATDGEKEIIRLQPRRKNSPAIMAADGLFGFGAEVKE